MMVCFVFLFLLCFLLLFFSTVSHRVKSIYVLNHHKQNELQVMTFNTLCYSLSGYVFVNT